MKVSLDMKLKECLCGKRECRGISSAFLLLNDSRSGFTSLPKKSETDHEMNGLRNAYLRYMFPNAEQLEEINNEVLNDNDDIQQKTKKKKYYIANHHFHPEIVKQSTEVVAHKSSSSMRSLDASDDETTYSTTRILKARIPMFISVDDLTKMGIQSTMSDLVMEENGLPAGDYCYVVPNYSLHNARKDAGLEAKVRRLVHERRYMMMDDDEPIACMISSGGNSVEQEQTIKGEDITAAVKQNEELSLSKVPIATAASTASTDISVNTTKESDLDEVQSLSMVSSPSISYKPVDDDGDDDDDDDEPQLMVSDDGSLRGLTCVESVPKTTSGSETEESSYDDSFSSPSCHYLSSTVIGDDDGSKSGGGGPRTCTSIFNELQKYEFQRRATNQENVRDEFQSMMQMLRHGIEECLQYEHLLHGMAAANHQYAMAMKSICNSYDKSGGSSNSSGNAATAVAQSTKNGFKTLFQRGRNRNTNTNSPTRRSNLAATTEDEVSATNNNGKSNGSSPNVTSSLIHIHSALADELHDTSNHISNDISKEMTHYREKLDYKVNHEVDKKGMDVIHLIDSSESLVKEAWDTYYEAAAEKSRDHSIHHNNCGNSSLSSNSDASVEASLPSCDALRYTADLWVTELHYRAAVEMYLVAKQKWDNLRKEIAAIESERQMKVQEVLLSYLPRQRRAFSTFSELQKPMLNNLMSQNHTSPGTKDEDTLNQGRNHPHDSSSSSSSKRTTSSPLSPIVNSGTVMLVERKIGRDTWNNTLAITSYSLLHLFHIPSTISKMASSSAEETLENLVAPLYATSVHNNKKLSSSSGGGTTIAQVLETLTPFQSFNLPECKIYVHDGGMEVEIDNADSFSRGFVQLRTSSQKEMSKLLDSNNIS